MQSSSWKEIAKDCRKRGYTLLHNRENHPVVDLFLQKGRLEEDVYKQASMWGWSPFLQIVNINKFRHSHVPDDHLARWKRHEVETADGGSVNCDVWDVDSSPLDGGEPLLIILPGLTGGIREPYVALLADTAVHKFGFKRVATLVYRGVSGSKITSPMTASGTTTDDEVRTMNWLRERYPNSPMVAIGFSFGGVKLVRYLSETSAEKNVRKVLSKLGHTNVDAHNGKNGTTHPLLMGVSVSNPIDLQIGSREIPWIYEQRLSGILRRIMAENWDVLQHNTHGVVLDTIQKVRRIRQFDEAVTCRLHGFATPDDYYKSASSIHRFERVDVPLIVVNALDDPVAPASCLHLDEMDRMVHKNPNLVFCLTKHGSHCAFFESRKLGDPTWIERVFPPLLYAIARHSQADASAGATPSGKAEANSSGGTSDTD